MHGRCTTDEIDGVLLPMEKERENIWGEGKSISLLLIAGPTTFGCLSFLSDFHLISGTKPLVDVCDVANKAITESLRMPNLLWSNMPPYCLVCKITYALEGMES